MQPQIISVSEFLAIINETLAFAYPQVVVEGEISSFKVNQGKFVFFDLKDAVSTLSCFMMVHQLKFPLEDGMKVRVVGAPKITKFSKFSLTVRNVELAGEGELRRAMELLRRKLDAEGLFDPSRKRPIPQYPQRIGLITSATSAAYSDFVKILEARWGGLDIVLADVTVQGQTAPDQIVNALEYFNQLTPPVDTVVLIRGGGSLEDLSAFSTEPVTRAVAASRTPIIVGVGHEVDTSLADYAADLRAATPTDAARLVTPDRTELSATIYHHERRIANHIDSTIVRSNAHIERTLGRLENYLRRPREAVDRDITRLWRSFDQLGHQQHRRATQVGDYRRRLSLAQQQSTARQNTKIAGLTRILQSFDPQGTLQRGYAIARDANGRILRQPDAVQEGETIMLQLAKGKLHTKVHKS